MHTTNYLNTFIFVADDCPVTKAEVPPQKEIKTVASMQFDMLKNAPYQHTSDEVLFQVFAAKNNIPETARASERDKLFSKGQPCFRSSPLTKRYGWGVHFNQEGKMALYAIESDEYRQFSQDNSLKTIKAMRTSK